MIVALLAIVLTLLLVIGLHEAGHAIAAKLAGVKIQRISLGFGKPILRWRSKTGCEWVWAIFPLGGYVQLLNTRITPVAEADHFQCFDKKPVWVRIAILLAGGLMNLLVAWLALTLYFALGYQQLIPQIKSVAPNTTAATASIKAGDRIVAIGGTPIASWQEAGVQLITHLGKNEVPMSISDSSLKTRIITVSLKNLPKAKNNSLFTAFGIEPDVALHNQERVEGKPILTAAYLAIAKCLGLLGFFFMMLKLLFTGIISFSALLGPISLLALSTGSLMQGLPVFFYFIASLSLAVGLVNLFPVPSLDGGTIIYALVEKIRGKPVSIAMEVLLHQFAVIIFCLVLVQLIMNDLQRYLGH